MAQIYTMLVVQATNPLVSLIAENFSEKIEIQLESDNLKQEIPQQAGNVEVFNSKMIIYAPVVFRAIQKSDGDMANIQKSFNLLENYQQLNKQFKGDGGKGGEFFYFSFDKAMIIKTMTEGEIDVFLKNLKEYINHFVFNEDSLIVKIYGVYTFIKNDQKNHILIIRNVTQCPSSYIERTYDIKGSSYDREVLSLEKNKGKSPKEITLKDLDFINLEKKVHISTKMAQRCANAIEKDALFFQRYLNIIPSEREPEQLKSGLNNILVAIRVRPLNQKELEKSDFEVVRILDQRLVVLIDPGYEFNQNDVLRKNRNKETQYAFDFAFDQNDVQEEVFEKTSNFLLDGVLEGFNATVFAYGATGAGKTYTMIGYGENIGIMQRTMNQLYNLIQKFSVTNEYVVKVGYLEIYNENIKDLLSSEDKNLDLREDPSQGVVVTGITEVQCETSNEIIQILKIGNKNRSQDATGANEYSSRSHAVLQVEVQIKEKGQGIEQKIHYAKLSMVDLAGSERAANTKNRGIRMIEGAKINQSLLCLGNCIQALSEIQDKHKQNQFVSYRGSKLTRLLKDSLGGNCRTVMLANISPSVLTFEDTYNTLNFANRAKNIKTNVKRNILNVDNHISNYAQIINNLRQENENLKKMLQEKQNVNLPPIANNNQQFEQQQNDYMDKNEKNIVKHFQLEQNIIKNSQDVDAYIDKVNSQIQNILQENNNSEQVKEKIESLKNNLENLQNQKEEYTNKYINLVDKRNDILTQIRQVNLTQPNINYLMNIYKVQQAQTENLELQQKEYRQEMSQKQKAQQIQFLQQQIKIREGIIGKEEKKQLKTQKNSRETLYQNKIKLQKINSNSNLHSPVYNFFNQQNTPIQFKKQYLSNKKSSPILDQNYYNNKNNNMIRILKGNNSNSNQLKRNISNINVFNKNPSIYQKKKIKIGINQKKQKISENISLNNTSLSEKINKSKSAINLSRQKAQNNLLIQKKKYNLFSLVSIYSIMLIYRLMYSNFKKDFD
ncbi:kinesin motor domain protein [Ichthyophthirius multifiliis]|uniref:Kinesin-like protein KIN-8B n=1 Tax=Ichthyophthirius multifiliis TaxID=5932 RepID=G0R1Q6_ICHMU|nr:kinesin motor domain protein [Ichthyophthirius multifiliis]EGR28601.1 kinesin motor domain protein [Ichthyophthirius multifiliis]|eukprot:XP_004029837.1 kinesin motor domain protein [Ichthyophthirius multifiliis]